VKYDRNLYTVGLQSRDHVTEAFEEADLVICVGYDIVEFAPRFWNIKGDKKIVHIDFTQAEVDFHYDPLVEIIGDIAGTLWELNEQLPDDMDKTRCQFADKHRAAILADIHEYDDDTSFPIKPQKILHDIRQVMGADDILISDVGAHKLWIGRMYLVYAPNTCIISNGFATMGIALPGGIAAKLVYPDRKVLTISGDGGFLMNAQELETAIRCGAPTVNMIWSDGTFGLIEWHQEKKFGHAFGTRFGNPDWVKFAESCGAIGMRVNEGDNLQEVLKKAFEYNRPVVIDCPVDYSENLKLTKRLGSLVGPI
jgi:acetolactate synthase-1/2/3 large subunit